MRTSIAAGLCLVAATAVSALAQPFVYSPPIIEPAIYEHRPPRSGEEESTLCTAIADRYAELGLTTSEMCTIALPETGAFRRPTWRAVDPAANLDAIKEGFFWQFLGQQVNYGRYYNAEHQAFIRTLHEEW